MGNRQGGLRGRAGWAVGLLLVLSSGCSLIPEYQRPAAPVPRHFPGATSPAETALPPWRDYFSDPVLQQLIEAALANNRNLRIAVARVQEARGLAGIARADRFPSVNAQASENASRTPSDILNSTQARTISRRFDVGLALTAFELDFWGRTAALSEAAQAQYLATDEAARSFSISLIGDVAITWFQLSELGERERMTEEALRNREENIGLLRKRRDAGFANDLDVYAAESLVETLRVQLSELRRQRLQTENALRLLTGTTVALPVPADTVALPAIAELAPGLPSDVLLRRPDVRAAEQRLIAANANIGAARAAFFPRIALTAGYGTASRSLSGLFGAGSHAWSFQPVLTLPLFNAGGADANLDAVLARKTVAVADYEKTIQQAFSEVSDALAARSTYSEQLNAQLAGLRAQQERYRRVKAREEAGVANYLEVLDANRDVLNAAQSAVTLRRQVLSTAAALYKSLGGGAEAGSVAAK